jgi:UPF0755 protein
MSRRMPRRELEERRNARMRELRNQRESPIRRRRRLQPVVLLAWFAGVIAVLAFLIFVGFLAFAPRLMSWVESHPGAIDNGLVHDFVSWYQPSALEDTPASDQRKRVTVVIASGMTDAAIGDLLTQQGVVRSPLAFQWAVKSANRTGTLAFGTYDLSPTMKPSEIVATLRGQAFEQTAVTIREGLRVEEIVATFAASDMTMNIGEFAKIVKEPPPDLLNEFDFLNNLPKGRSLEGYLAPNTYEFKVNEAPLEVVRKLLTAFGTTTLPKAVRDGIKSQGLTIDQAVIIASIVEREAVKEEERPLIAAVYINRFLNPNNGETNGLLNADPTLQYGLATAESGASPLADWGTIEWWKPLEVSGGDVQLPEALAGYQTYLHPGLPPTPIAAPRACSLAGVAMADLGQGYLYFVAGCPGGTRDGSHYFAKTNAQQVANTAKARTECGG